MNIKVNNNIIYIFLLMVFIMLIGNIIKNKINKASIINTKNVVYENVKEKSLVSGQLLVIDESQTEKTDIGIKTNVLEMKKEFKPTFSNIHELNNFELLTEYLYTIDETAYVDKNDLDIDKFLEVDLSTNLQTTENNNQPKVLIFHTHSQETFIDSVEGEEKDTIVGVGTELAIILANDYNVSVIHDVGKYDLVNGKIERGNSYEKMQPAIMAILKKYPSIEVLIDLHRDGVPDNIHLMENINGKDTAKIMFFNGVTCGISNGKPLAMPNLVNPYLTENLAFSLQLQLTANNLYPDLTRNIYIKPYRYSLNMAPKSTLVEVGANTNTLQEAKNAMPLLAEILVKTLTKHDLP